MYFLNTEKQFDNRYELGRFMAFAPDCHDVLDSYFLRELRLLPPQGNYEVTTAVGRPDLLSYAVYNTTQYWWLLMYYNRLLSPADIVIGMIIQYPAKSALEQIYFTLSSRKPAE